MEGKDVVLKDVVAAPPPGQPRRRSPLSEAKGTDREACPTRRLLRGDDSR